MTDAYVIGEGLRSDQTSTITFGLGIETDVKPVDIALSDCTTQSIESPKINTVNTL